MGTGRPVVRAVADGDLPALRDLFRRSALVHQEGRAALLAHPEHLEFALPSQGEWCCLLAMADDGTILGFATALFPGGWAELEDLFVDPDHMGLGVGRLLAAAIEDVARHRRLERIEVTANPNAVGFYEKVGFIAGPQVETALGPAVRMRRTVR